MFNKEKSNQTERFAPTNATMISAGTVLTGDVVSDNDLRIDGQVNGNVTCSSKIIIGASGFVVGNIDGQTADVSGRVAGNITVSDLLQLRGSGDLKGNIAAGKLQIEPSATFNGHCQMTFAGSLVQMTTNEAQAEAQ